MNKESATEVLGTCDTLYYKHRKPHMQTIVCINWKLVPPVFDPQYGGYESDICATGLCQEVPCTDAKCTCACHYPVSDPTGEARKDLDRKQLTSEEKKLFEGRGLETTAVMYLNALHREAAALAENRVLRESMQAIKEKLGKPMPRKYHGVTGKHGAFYAAPDVDSYLSEVREVCK